MYFQEKYYIKITEKLQNRHFYVDYLNVRDDGTERITLRKNVKTRDYLFVTEALEEKG